MAQGVSNALAAVREDGAGGVDARTVRRRRRPSPRSLELLEAKFAVPAPQPGTVMRTGLVNRLRAASQGLVTIVAPAGYGKTTLLAQWAERDERPFAWVALDEDDDADVVPRYAAAALHAAGAIDDPRGATSPARLAAAFSRITAPVVLVLDDVHSLRSRESARLLETLAAHVPAGSTLALAGRALPELPLARRRAAGGLAEIGANDLVLGRREAQALLRSTGLQLDERDAAALIERTEGWAAGLQLAGLVLQPGRWERRRPVADFTGDDRFVADYFRFEHLSSLGRADLRFLTRTAVLDSMCGPLCDAVLSRRQGSTRKLESLERSSLFVVPLDRNRVWYRYQHLFRETLRAELERREPGLVPVLNRRAAAWCEENGELEAARRYAAAADDVDFVARLVATHTLPAYADGRITDLEPWLDGFGDPALLERHPRVAVVGSWIHALGGRPDHAALWLEAAEHAAAASKPRAAAQSIEPWVVLLRAAFCTDGVDRMQRDAERAEDTLPWWSRWRPTAIVLRAIAHLLQGENERADELLVAAVDAAAAIGAPDIRRLALAERSLLAAAAGDHVRGRELAHAALPPGECPVGADATTALALAALARAELRAADWQAARAALLEAERLVPTLTHALPWCSVQAALELARAHMALLDTVAAATLVSTADAILERRPGLGALVTEATTVRAELEALRDQNGRRESMLTAAELRLLPLLSTRLSFREIGERLHVSRNTVKTQAIAVYRKLGVSSRNDAIDRAAELGLLDASAHG